MWEAIQLLSPVRFWSETTSPQAHAYSDENHGVDTQVGAVLSMGIDWFAIIEASFDCMGGAKITLRRSEGSIEISELFDPPENSSIRVVRGNREETVVFDTGRNHLFLRLSISMIASSMERSPCVPHRTP